MLKENLKIIDATVELTLMSPNAPKCHTCGF